MSVNRNNTDSYEEQLRQLFNSCDEEQCGFLDRSQLYELSEKLQLDEEQTSYIVDNLICDQFSKINFNEFKEVFVSLLTQTQLFNNSNNNYSNNYSTDNIKELIEKDQFNISHKNSTNSINSSEFTDSSEKVNNVHQNTNDDFNNRSRLIKLNRCKKNKKKYETNNLDDKNVLDRKDFKQDQQSNRKNGLTDHNMNNNNHNKKIRNSSSGTEEGYSSLDDCGSSSSSSCPNVESPDLVGLSNDEDKINNSKSKKHLNHLHHYHQFLDQNDLEEDDQSSTFSTTNLNNKNCELLHEDIEQSTEQYLSSIWEQLNVGKEGYLTLKELFIVCEHIQMGTMDEELIEQLFNKLDSDNDGKVSFDELLRQLTTSSESNEFNNNTNTSVEQNRKNSLSCSNSSKNYQIEDSITKSDLDDLKTSSNILNSFLNEKSKDEEKSEINLDNLNEVSLNSNKNSFKPLPISQPNSNNNYSAFNSFYESPDSANLEKEDESINGSKEPLNKYLTVNSYNDLTKNYHKLNSSSTINLSNSCANVPSLLNSTQDSFCLPKCSTELDDQQSIISKTVCHKRSNSLTKDTSLENSLSIDHKFKNLNQHHHSNHSNHFNQCRNNLNKNLNNNNENLLNNTSSKINFLSSIEDTCLNNSNYKTGVICDKNYCLSSKTEFNNNENELSINKCIKSNCDKDCDKYLEQGDNYSNSKHTIEEFSANNISSNCRYSSSNVSTPELEHPNILNHHSHLHSSHHHYHIHSSSINNNVDHQHSQTAEEEDFFNLTGFGNLLSLDPFNYGYIKVSNLLSLWEQLGINNGKLILEEMGLSSKVNRIQNSEFFTMLEDTLRCSLPYSTNRDLFNAVFNTIKHEYKYLRQNYDQVKEERDKLRTSIMEANNRADLLAQEVDENHAKLEQSTQNKLLLMEKKYQEQLKYLQEELQNEREVVNIQIARLRSDCEQQVKNMQQINNKCKEYCTQLEQDNKRLEKELQECSNQLQESDKCNNEYQKELEDAIVMKKKLSELETMQSFLREREYDSLMVKMDLTRKENKELQDKNDELQMELEQLRSQLAKQESKRRNRRRRNSSEEEENDSINYDSQQLNKLFFVSQPLNRRSSKDWQPHCVPQSFYAGN